MPEPHNKSFQSFKVSAYPDDVTVFITTNDSFTALNEELEKFEVACGSKLNRNKSKRIVDFRMVKQTRFNPRHQMDNKINEDTWHRVYEELCCNGSRKLEFTA